MPCIDIDNPANAGHRGHDGHHGPRGHDGNGSLDRNAPRRRHWLARGLSACATLSASLLVAGLAGCGSRSHPPAAPSAPSPPARPAVTLGVQVPSGPGAPSLPSTPRTPPPPAIARDWEDYRRRAAQRMVALHPNGSYLSQPPEPLLAIPVLEVELDGEGGVRDVRVLRQPSQARDTVALAIAAVRRAAPFGPVRHLPRPWRFTEAFLFDDQRRFKPRSLD